MPHPCARVPRFTVSLWGILFPLTDGVEGCQYIAQHVTWTTVSNYIHTTQHTSAIYFTDTAQAQSLHPLLIFHFFQISVWYVWLLDGIRCVSVLFVCIQFINILS